MKTDIYTKAVLTVIAACLCIQVIKEIDVIPTAKAGNNVTDFNSAKYGLVPLNADGSMNVKFSETMKVEIDRVNCTVPVKTTELVHVKIKEVESSAFSNCPVPIKQGYLDVINVKIKEVDQSAFYNTTLQVKMKQ